MLFSPGSTDPAFASGTSGQTDGLRRAALLVNRRARNGSSAIDGALDLLRANGFELEELSCGKASEVAQAVRERSRELDLVIVGGGDGTINCTAPALVATGLPFGILPLGTANDLARTLGIPPDPVAAAAVIAQRHIRPIDLGEVNGHLFFNVASIGFSAELARELTHDAKQRWGVLGYGISAARLLMKMRPFRAYIEHDGRTEKVSTVQISVGNGRHYGGGMTVEASAEPDDGRFDVYSLELDHWWQLVPVLPSLRRGTQGNWQRVRAFSTAEVTIRTRHARPVNTDGELTTATPAVFRIIPKAVRVLAPAPTRSLTA